MKPPLREEDTADLLAYYMSDSSSDYSSSDSFDSPRKRPTNSSEGATDRRRLAIVETDLVAPPDASPESYDSAHLPTIVEPDVKEIKSAQPPVVTPDIGQSKPIDVPVAPPVVLSLEPANEYLDYQPGFHATAGPLPAPPLPHHLQQVKQALQLPPSVSAVLAKRLDTQPSRWDSPHRREGAFSPSQDIRQAAGMEEPEIIIQSPTTPAEPPMDASPRTSADSRTSAELSTSSHTPSAYSRSAAPSPPPKSPKSFRQSLTKGLKRMSLPRTPSYKSLARSSSIGHSSSQPRTPSPTPPLSLPRQQRPKIRSLYPAAMYCHEVNSIRNVQERCLLYARKINELYSCDCGLGDWLLAVQLQKSNPSHSTLKLNADLAISQFSPQPRHTSNSSNFSETTFPSRPDAYTATDLGIKSAQEMPTAPPPLPYPALINRVNTSPSATRPSKAGNFFASLGRKTSISSRNHRQPGAMPTSPPTRLVKSPPPTMFRANPTVPGGPRAPTSRASRSQTMMISSPFSTSSSSVKDARSLSRSPSLIANSPSPPAGSSDSVRDISSDPEFTRQVNKLANLLPHANRDILAGYLRRAGQDMLAIGQYLEDEKAGNLIKFA